MRLLDFFFNDRRTLPVLLQSEVAECGLTCVMMVAAHFGVNVQIEQIRARYPAGNAGLTMKQLAQIGHELGLTARVLKLELSQLQQIQKPVILYWNHNHFVTLADTNDKFVVIHDPAKGRLRLRWAMVALCFTGLVVELRPQSA